LDKTKAYSLDLISLIESGKIVSRERLNEAKIELCSRHKISDMPSNATILSFAKKRTDVLLSLLKVKPTRSLSGITVVAIMSKPHNCPGNAFTVLEAFCRVKRPLRVIPGKSLPQ